jgi:hypothetical protein
MNYTDYESANILIDGFTYGFKINYTDPRTPVVCKNLKSIYQYPEEPGYIGRSLNADLISGFEQRAFSPKRCTIEMALSNGEY